ncbi:MAG: helix-turn-helix transcriptional regulator [Microlunatus sp.]
MADSGLTQAAFARALGTSRSRFSTYLAGRTVPSASLYLKALRLGAALREARERSLLTPPAAASGIRDALAAGDQVWALRLALQCRDHLRYVLAEDPRVSGAWGASPGSAGATEWERLLAALIGHEFEIRQLDPPDWTVSASADGPWLLGSPFFTTAEVQAATPAWLAERGIFVAARDLVTA